MHSDTYYLMNVLAAMLATDAKNTHPWENKQQYIENMADMDDKFIDTFHFYNPTVSLQELARTQVLSGQERERAELEPLFDSTYGKALEEMLTEDDLESDSITNLIGIVHQE